MLKIGVDTSDLVEFSKRTAKAANLATPAISVGLNEVGNSLVSLMTRRLSQDTGLSLEQVRGLMEVKSASPTDLAYEIKLSTSLLDEKIEEIEGQRESKDFGKRRPGALVIIVTRKDDLVCAECSAWEAAGPMPIETAREHVPVHNHCRCIIMPYTPKQRRLPVTMTSVTGTSAGKRAGQTVALDIDLTLRQLAQNIMDQAKTSVRIALL